MTCKDRGRELSSATRCHCRSARRDDRILDDFDDIIDGAVGRGRLPSRYRVRGWWGSSPARSLAPTPPPTAFEAEKVEATATFGA